MKIMRPREQRISLWKMCSELSLRRARMVEVGCYTGESSEIFANCVGSLICVDAWTDFVDPMQKRNDKMEDVEKVFDRRMSIFPNVIKIKALSQDAWLEVRSMYRKVDFVYIDASHDLYSVRKDIENWHPLVVDGGYIGGHDYTSSCPGVIRAVNERFGKPDKVYADSSWVVKKGK